MGTEKITKPLVRIAIVPPEFQAWDFQIALAWPEG